MGTLVLVLILLNIFLIWWSCRKKPRHDLGFWRPGLSVRQWGSSSTEIKVIGKTLPYGSALLTIRYSRTVNIRVVLDLFGREYVVYVDKEGGRQYICILGLWIMWLDRRGRGDSILEVHFRGKKLRRVFRYKDPRFDFDRRANGHLSIWICLMAVILVVLGSW